MIKRLLRLAARVAILAAVLWLARLALKRWVDGPEPEPGSEPWPPVRESAATSTTPAPTPATEPPAGSPAWVEPNGTGDAPASHPIKAKVSSKVYREPGMAGYESSKPDRCYGTAEAAEADGFTRAKR